MHRRFYSVTYVSCPDNKALFILFEFDLPVAPIAINCFSF